MRPSRPLHDGWAASDEAMLVEEAGFAGESEATKIEGILDACDADHADLVNSVGKSLRTALHTAAEEGDEESVKLLLARGATVDPVDKNRRTPLHLAAENGHRGVAALLLDAKADIHATDWGNTLRHQGRTPLHLAAKNGHRDVVTLLLDRHADVNTEKTDGWQPIHQAVKYGHLEVVELLIKRGAFVDSIDEEHGWTPLHIACREGHADIAARLLRCNADINQSDIDGCTALHLACLNHHDAVVSLLIERRADIDAAMADGSTPLHHVSWKGYEGLVSLLIAKGAKVDKVNKAGATPLHLASFDGSDEVVSLLLAAGANANAAKQIDGSTPLHLAARKGHSKIATLLLESGASVDAVKEDGCTPLHVAAQNGKHEVAALLLEHGAKVAATAQYGSSPLHLACQTGSGATVELLINTGAAVDARKQDGRTPLHFAAESGHFDAAHLLLQSRATVDAEDVSGCTPLWLACRNNRSGMASLLIDSAANVEGTRNSRKGWTNLFVACQHGHASVVSLLLARGANMEAQNPHGETPLHLAVWTGKHRIAHILMERGADLGALKRGGETDLHVATLLGDMERVRTLVDRGADLEAVTNRGSTALAAAVCSRRLDVAQFLLSRGAKIDAQNTADWCKGYTSLHHACFSGNFAMAKMLLDHGASPRLLNQYGQTPLYLAAQEGHTPVVELLVSEAWNRCELEAIDTKDKEGRTPLWIASTNGHMEVVEMLLRYDASVHVATATAGASPLFTASENGHHDIVVLLLRKGAVVDRRDKEDRTPLFVAASGGHDDVVSTLLKHRADASCRAKDGKAPLCAAIHAIQANTVRLLRNADAPYVNGLTDLHIACVLGSRELLEDTLRRGVDIDSPYFGRWSPLDFAAPFNRVELAKILLEHKANIAGVDPNGATPLHSAACWGKEQMARLLLEHGADINARDITGKTPVHFASQHGKELVLSLLLQPQYEADVDARDALGETALHLASRMGKLHIMKLLLRHGAIIDASSEDGATPLLVASEFGHAASIKLLLDSGARVGGSRNSATTPLHLAAAQGRLDVVSLLLARAADTAALDRSKKSAARVAAESGHKAVVERLASRHSHGRDPYGSYTELDLACIFGETARVKALLESSHADLRRLVEGRCAPFNLACRAGHEGVVRELLAVFAESGIAVPTTSLRTAAYAGQDHVVRSLVQCGVDVNDGDYEGRAALHIAAELNDVEVASTLLQSGRVDPNLRDRSGHTALSLASKAGHSHVAQLLLERGADPSVADNDGRTPLWWAARYGWNQVIAVLLQKSKKELESRRTSDASSVLHAAAEGGFRNAVLQLLEQGASPNYCSTSNCAPLAVAACSNLLEIAALLLKHGAQVNAQDEMGLTALHKSAQRGHVSMVQMLLDYEADRNVLSKRRETALYIAAKEGHSRIVSMLWSEGTIYSLSGLTDLHIRCSLGHLEDIDLLLQAGASLTATTVTGYTPLLMACASGKADVVKRLAQLGAALEDGPLPALHVACSRGKVEVVALLLDLGADKEAEDASGATPMRLAAMHGRADVVALLASRGASVNSVNRSGESPLCIAAAHGQSEVVSFFLRKGSRIDGRSGSLAGPLRAAIWSGHEEVVRMLLASSEYAGSSMRGTETEAAKTEAAKTEAARESGRWAQEEGAASSPATPMLLSDCCDPVPLAARCGRIGLVRLLLDRKEDVNGTVGNHVTALHISVAARNFALARLLLDRGADVNAPFEATAEPEARNAPASCRQAPEVKSFALHLASKDGDEGMARLLLDNDARVDVRDSTGRSPLYCAINAASSADEGRYLPLVELLLCRGASNSFVLANLARRKGLVRIANALDESRQRDPSSGDETETETVAPSIDWQMEGYDPLGWFRTATPPCKEAHAGSFALDISEEQCPRAETGPMGSKSLAGLEAAGGSCLRRSFDAATDCEEVEGDAKQDADIPPASHWYYEMQSGKRQIDPSKMNANPGEVSATNESLHRKAACNDSASERSENDRFCRSSMSQEGSKRAGANEAASKSDHQGEAWTDDDATQDTLARPCHATEQERTPWTSTPAARSTLQAASSSRQGVEWAIQLIQVNKASSGFALHVLRVQRKRILEEFRRRVYPKVVLQTMLYSLMTIDVEIRNSISDKEGKSVNNEILTERALSYRSIAALLKRMKNTPEQERMAKEFTSLISKVHFLGSTSVGMDPTADEEEEDPQLAARNLPPIGQRPPPAETPLPPADDGRWNFIDLILMMAQRKREPLLEPHIPTGDCLAFILGIYMEMHVSDLNQEDSAYAARLSRILESSMRSADSRIWFVDRGRQAVHEASSRTRSTAMGQVCDGVSQKSSLLSRTEVLLTSGNAVRLLDLHALARLHEFPVVLIHTGKQRGCVVPSRIMVIVPDDRLMIGPLSLEELSNHADVRDDRALWLVLTQETEDPSLLHARPTFRWPQQSWLDLSAPSLYRKTLNEYETDALRKLKRTCENKAGFSLTKDADLLRSIFFYLSMTADVKRAAIEERRRRESGNDPASSPQTASAAEKKAAKGSKRETRDTLETAWLTDALTLRLRQLLTRDGHKSAKKYLVDKCKNLWRPRLRRVDYAGESLNRGFAIPVENAKRPPDSFEKKPDKAAPAEPAQGTTADDEIKCNASHDAGGQASSFDGGVTCPQEERLLEPLLRRPVHFFNAINPDPRRTDMDQTFYGLSDIISDRSLANSPAAGGSQSSSVGREDALTTADAMEELDRLLATYRAEDADAHYDDMGEGESDLEDARMEGLGLPGVSVPEYAWDRSGSPSKTTSADASKEVPFSPTAIDKPHTGQTARTKRGREEERFDGRPKRMKNDHFELRGEEREDIESLHSAEGSAGGARLEGAKEDLSAQAVAADTMKFCGVEVQEWRDPDVDQLAGEADFQINRELDGAVADEEDDAWGNRSHMS